MTRQATVGSCLILCVILFTGACRGSSSDRAGGAQHPVTTLSMANGNSTSTELVPFADEVERLSGGRLRIRFENAWRHGRPDYEQALIQDVRTGKVPLGWVGSRAWDSVGVVSFDALHAPLLLDSYALERDVVESALAGEMLKGVGPLGLVGIGVLPGPLRKPLAPRPLLTPTAFKGLRIGIQQSRVATRTLRALGATPVAIPSGAPIDSLDGIEQHLSSIYGNEYDATAKHLAANVNLWPRPLVLFMGKGAYDKLEPAQREALRKAARNAGPGILALTERSEDEAVAGLCRRGVSFETATAADLAQLRAAVEPVYTGLERNAQTRSFIVSINKLRETLGGRAEPAPRCSGASPSGGTVASNGATPLDGVYRTTVSRNQLAKHEGVAPARVVAENYGDFTLVVDHGRFAFTQENADACTWQYGRARLDGDELSWTFTDGGGIAPNNAQNKPGERFVWRWSLYRETLELRPVQPSDLSPVTWQRVATKPSARYLSRRCPPPPSALPR